jgi:hypothetical protein
MGQLMGQQLTPGRLSRGRAEDDVAVKGERGRFDRLRCPLSFRTRVDAHSAEVVAESRLHYRPGLIVQCRTIGGERGLDRW